MKSKIYLASALIAGTCIMASGIKVDVCHNVDNNPHVITVALPAAIAHLAQHSSDSLGECQGPNKI